MFKTTSYFRLAKQKVLQADFDKEVSSVRGEVDSLKSKNNVSTIKYPTAIFQLYVAAIEL